VRGERGKRRGLNGPEVLEIGGLVPEDSYEVADEGNLGLEDRG
jgi:hypothetical protein